MSTLPAIFLNQEFYTKARNRKFVKEHGCEAIVILQMVWLASSQEKDCKIKKEECFCLPFPVFFEETKVKTILDAAVQVGLLDEEGEYYYNSQIVSNNEKFQEKQKRYSDSAKRREEQKQNESRILPESCEDSATNKAESQLTVNSKQLTVKVNNKKENDILVFPEKLDNEPCRNAWNSWLEHKKTRGERYKSVQSQQQKLKEWAEKPEEFIEAINFSMGNNWAGIFPKREIKQANAPNQQRKLSPTELSIQAAQRISERINAGKTLFLEDSKK